MGTVSHFAPSSGGRNLRICSPLLSSQMQIGDSVAVNGVCQTVVEIEKQEFKIQAVSVTLKKTTLGELREGNRVNLELALTPQDRLGGHFLQGHVNGVGRIAQIQKQGGDYRIFLRIPTELQRYIIQEGSVAVDGISLTVAEYQSGAAQMVLAIIPHTWENTTLQYKKAGDKVNIEVDILAKYVESMLSRLNPSKELRYV